MTAARKTPLGDAARVWLDRIRIASGKEDVPDEQVIAGSLVPRASYYRIKNGSGGVTEENLQRLADYFGAGPFEVIIRSGTGDDLLDILLDARERINAAIGRIAASAAGQLDQDAAQDVANATLPNEETPPQAGSQG